MSLDIPTIVSICSLVVTAFIAYNTSQTKIEILQLKIWIMNEFEPRKKVLTHSEE